MNIFFGNSPRYKIKPIFLGDEHVGKTSIIAKYTSSEYKNGTNIDFYSKNIELLDEKINLMIFDIKGHNSFERVIIPYIKDVNAFIIIFDLTCLSSFYNVSEWINKIKKYNNTFSSYQYYPILLIGNKRDLEKERVIKYEEAEKYAMYNKLLYIEMSNNDDSIRLNMTLDTYFYKIITLNNNESSSCYINYSNVFDNKHENNIKKSDIKLVTSKSIDNIELLNDKYKGNKYYYECKKTMSQCNIL